MKIVPTVMILSIVAAEAALIVTIISVIAIFLVIRSVAVIRAVTIREEMFLKMGHNAKKMVLSFRVYVKTSGSRFRETI